MAEGSTILAPAEEKGIVEIGNTGRPELRLVTSNERRPYLKPLLEGEKAIDEDVVTITTYATGGIIVNVRKMVIAGTR